MYATIQHAAGRREHEVRGGPLASAHDDREWLATLIAVQEGRSPVPLLDDAGIRALLLSRPRIAIVGASANPDRPSHGVLVSLRRAGYDVVPVNPCATAIDGLRCFPSVGDAVRETGPVDIVDVFRRPDKCVEPAREAVAVGARCLWLQLGVANAEAGRIAHAAGLAVVMDRCTIIEHRRLVAG
jgi:predicted CoA-binding protein